MDKNSPKSIKKAENILRIEWRDGLVSIININTLRNECPCAQCRDELTGEKKPRPKFQMFTVGMNELKELKPIGNYAVKAVWGDGHETGIYTWEFLREISAM